MFYCANDLIYPLYPWVLHTCILCVLCTVRSSGLLLLFLSDVFIPAWLSTIYVSLAASIDSSCYVDINASIGTYVQYTVRKYDGSADL